MIESEVMSELKALRSEVSRLKREDLSVSDNIAQEIIEEKISELKKRGKAGVDVLILYSETTLPFDQINKIMSKLEKQGKVTSDEKS